MLEVVVAIAILMLFLVPLLGSIARGLMNVATMENRSTALHLAQDKMMELEMMTFPDAEGVDDGDFGPDFPNYKWRTEMVKSPEIQLMESQLVGLKGMEVHLIVSWKEGETEKSADFETLLLE